jgi:rifampin ADP-ribosylating transferase
VNGHEHLEATTSIAESIARSTNTAHVPVTFDRCDHLEGPCFHGIRFTLGVGDQLVAGRPSNFHEGRTSNHVFFAALLEPAAWAAELATALAGSDERGHVHVVEPTGPFEDDPNVTDKRFPGNVTGSYRTRHPMRVVDEVTDWPSTRGTAGDDGQPRTAAQQGLDVIED